MAVSARCLPVQATTSSDCSDAPRPDGHRGEEDHLGGGGFDVRGRGWAGGVLSRVLHWKSVMDIGAVCRGEGLEARSYSEDFHW